MQAIRIGKFIKEALTSDTDVNEVVEGRIFPLVAPEKTLFPFILYSRNAVEPSYTKDGAYTDTVSMTIEILDNTYEGSNDLAVSVINALQYKEGEIHGFNITDCRLVDAAESFDDAFIQTLVFNIEILK